MSTTPATKFIAPAKTTLENRQIALSLAYLAYCGDKITTAKPDAKIAALIKAGMEQIPVLCTNGVPNWTQVWGPVAYTTPGALYQDNLMYLVKNLQDETQYALAIRGTNPFSDLDWLMDDFDVLQQMPWPPGSTAQNATVLISEATSIALQALLNMTDGNNSLLGYLKGVAGSPIDLWVTGHSLGGCVASALGLHLKETIGAWDGSGTSTVSCVTFAAPTAGNRNFASLVENAFQDSVFDRVQCSLDIVPLAWAARNIVTVPKDSSDYNTSKIFDIYDLQEAETDEPPGVDFSEMEDLDGEGWYYIVLDSVLPMVHEFFKTLDYRQPFDDAEPLIGQYNLSYSAYDEDFEATAEAFASQAGYQHSLSYPWLLGVPQLTYSNVIQETESGDGSAEGASRPRAQFLRSLIVSVFDGLKTARLKAAQAEIGGQVPPDH